ncbi:MAG TPA: hypothetical protein VHV30_03345 [Polyangiaceae bacterium]|jgi:hypothetical protein|nr:hypothetical protein [Polyangiaceae bacterium]
MRHVNAFASTVCLLGIASAPLACFSDATSPPPPPLAADASDTDASAMEPDATSTPVDDAQAPAADARPPAVVPEAGEDAAPPIDAGPQPLTLTVLSAGAPESGINVVFQDATGAVVTTSVTGPAGSVSQLVAAGSQVTVLLGTPQNPNLVTIQDVAPGDALEVVDGPVPTESSGQNVSVSLPAPSWDASDVSEEVFAGPCYNPLPYPLYLSSYCTSAGQFPLLAIATEGAEIAYTYQLANAVPEGGLPDGSDAYPFGITRPWSTSNAVATVDAINAPSIDDDGTTTSTAGDVQLSYFETAGGITFSDPQGPSGVTGDGGVESAQFVMHPGYPNFLQGQATINRGTSNGVVFSGGATRAAAQATSLAMSFDLSTLPLITNSAIDASDGGTTSQPDVIWTSAGPLTAADGIFVSLQWFSNGTDDAGNTTYTNGTWTILSSSAATHVQAPALPTSLASWAPSADASFDSLPRVGAVKAPTFGGYGGLRATFGSLSFIDGYQVTVPPLPSNGTIYVVGIYPDEG